MRIAIITDIHEDFRMLEKAFGKLQSLGYDLLVCLGDITGFSSQFYDHSPDANACIDFLRQNAHFSLAGNHDLFSVQRLPSYHLERQMPCNWYELSREEQVSLTGDTLWLYEAEITPQLSHENRRYLQSLPEFQVFDTGRKKILFSHFMKPDHSGVSRWFPVFSGELRHHQRLMKEKDCRIAFAGHCHPQGISMAGKLSWTEPGFSQVRVKNSPKIVFCPAIVNGRSPCGFVLYDSDAGIIRPIPLN